MNMYWLVCLSFVFVLQTPSVCYADAPLSTALQLLVVTNASWEASHGTLQCFERAHAKEEWVAVGSCLPVMLGKSGMALGIGVCPFIDDTAPLKKEGDLKAPAGIFSLGSSFGFLPSSQMTHLHLDYLPLTDSIVAVDDGRSVHYNQIVDAQEVTLDWNSAEDMGKEPLYELGCVVNHNFPHAQPGKGSAIFLHIWRHEDAGTAGCTSMSRENLEMVLSWLDKAKNPLLVQFPRPFYLEQQSTYQLPTLSN